MKTYRGVDDYYNSYPDNFKRRHLNINNIKHDNDYSNSTNTFTFFDFQISNELNKLLYTFKGDFVLNIPLPNPSQIWIYATYPHRALRIGYWSVCDITCKKMSIMFDKVHVEHHNDLTHVTITSKMDTIKFTLKDGILIKIDGYNIIDEFKKALIQQE